MANATPVKATILRNQAEQRLHECNPLWPKSPAVRRHSRSALRSLRCRHVDVEDAGLDYLADQIDESGKRKDGRRWPRTYRPRTRCMTILSSGTWTKRWSASITSCTSPYAIRKVENRARQRPLSIRRLRRAHKSRGLGSILRATTRARKSRVATGTS